MAAAGAAAAAAAVVGGGGGGGGAGGGGGGGRGSAVLPPSSTAAVSAAATYRVMFTRRQCEVFVVAPLPARFTRVAVEPPPHHTIQIHQIDQWSRVTLG